MAKKKKSPIDYIVPININGLNGRMINMPAPPKKTRNMLVIYGLHSSLERWAGMAEALNKYGSITIPDLPGHGGMDSFYKLGEKPTLDNMADYLATFVKMRYRRKKVTIIGMSYGFVVVTKMLQKYPELFDKVDLVVSLVGAVHKDDFGISKSRFRLFRYGSSIGSTRPVSWFARNIALRGPFIRMTYRTIGRNIGKLETEDKEELEKRINFEVDLWQKNDIRTYMENALSVFKLDLCNKQVDLPVIHVATKGDRFFNNEVVEQHLNIIYKKVTIYNITMDAGHAPTVVAEAKDFDPFIPPKLRRILARNPV